MFLKSHSRSRRRAEPQRLRRHAAALRQAPGGARRRPLRPLRRLPEGEGAARHGAAGRELYGRTEIVRRDAPEPSHQSRMFPTLVGGSKPREGLGSGLGVSVAASPPEIRFAEMLANFNLPTRGRSGSVLAAYSLPPREARGGRPAIASRVGARTRASSLSHHPADRGKETSYPRSLSPMRRCARLLPRGVVSRPNRHGERSGACSAHG